MLDFLRLAIPIIPTHVRSLENNHWFTGDIRDYCIPAATRHVGKLDDGTTTTGELYHPFESLPSDYTDMAMKFYTHTINRTPYVEIKASPLKLLQGHNVYGFESIELGSDHMLGMLLEAFPQLAPILDLANTEVLHLDTTYLFRLPHQNMVQPTLDYMANLASGHRKARQIKYENYITWGNDGASIRTKAYGKFEEVKSQLHKLQKQADKGCMRSKSLVIAMNDALPFANAVLRLEARICKTYLTKNGYPSNLFQLIKLQHEQPELLLRLWHVAFDPILKTMEGEYMNFASDDELEALLKSKLVTYTKKGNPSYTKAYNAFDFYRSLRIDGYKKVKSRHLESRFYKRERELISCGISRSHLQNLHKNPNGKVIPFVRLFELKMADQLPPDYVQPVSQYTPKRGLHLVA
ncbi:phage/plasmid replication protein, II/X family [Acinetobacter baumannii]|uniref:phage/plasmid replication protein, II/X family n=12 Tax=Acinetobacter baumannii TaxID=470 RepID=UPI0002BA4E53|nr:phage/plasmid replication protein, II/X family [Acinetobacter baumannii]EXB08502.1 phage/plasmid replication family protein [Acinetobacter baumannii 1397084]EXC91352.1 phage/plasmid replication family protein [Acinetobacter baumannii 1051830]EXD21110.1 phage/plasmid replication family protein [Acinetobacter baumannii 34654]EYU47347.1 phage/plasmid replication family protein [Acinetobacter baumannii 1457504]KCW32488.1 phage/plasmid replication family protein [Acinetobacter baumannii 1032359]